MRAAVSEAEIEACEVVRLSETATETVPAGVGASVGAEVGPRAWTVASVRLAPSAKAVRWVQAQVTLSAAYPSTTKQPSEEN